MSSSSPCERTLFCIESSSQTSTISKSSIQTTISPSSHTMAPTMYSLLAISTIISAALCAPLDARHNGPKKIKDVCPVYKVNGALPTPTVQPAIIALGVGTQNYTCNSTTGSYSSNVALADLYDISRLVKSSSGDAFTKQYLAASQECDREQNPRHLKLIGQHFFDSAGIPNFDFGRQGLLQGKKVASAPAPAGASAGIAQDTHGAVDWLYLADNGKGVSRELLAVYRVETAGGKPPASCRGSEKYEVPYSAEYWFYDQTFS